MCIVNIQQSNVVINKTTITKSKYSISNHQTKIHKHSCLNCGKFGMPSLQPPALSLCSKIHQSNLVINKTTNKIKIFYKQAPDQINL